MSTGDDKLQHAQEWMRREILAQKKHIGEYSRSEDEILKSLEKYFPQSAFLGLTESCLKELITSEILFDTLILHPSIDGSGVILGYQKVYDTLFENGVTKGFRKYIRKLGKLQKPENTPLEKSLYQVVEKGFILSAGRIFEILENTKNHKDRGYFEASFVSYLQSSKELEMSLLTNNFLIHLRRLVYKKILGEKRHSGILSKDDAKLARKIYIGNLQDTDSLIWILAKIGSIPF